MVVPDQVRGPIYFYARRHDFDHGVRSWHIRVGFEVWFGNQVLGP